MPDIHSPFRLGATTLQNRFVMAPMTRARANPDGTPGPLAATYYGQRAGVGLTVTEGTQPSDDGQGYPATPGIYRPDHVQGWRAVNAAIHERGGRVFHQLMHAGRMSHPDNTPHGRQGVAPSAIAPGEQIFTLRGMQDIPTPRALTTIEVKATVNDYRHAARQAIASGADGVEIHGIAYLIHQFLAASSNTRDDRYGGSVENRSRFAIEVAEAVAEDIGPERVGIRLSPGFTGMGLDYGPERSTLFRHLIGALDRIGLAYLHLVHYLDDASLLEIRQQWRQALILNRPGRSRQDIGADVASGLADLESYGVMVLANPDFVARIASGAALNTAERDSYFGTDPGSHASGYTDFPALRP